MPDGFSQTRRFTQTKFVPRGGRASASTAQVAHQALALAKQANAAREVKGVRVGLTSPITSSGSVLACSTMAQGDGFVNRDGVRVKSVSLRISGSIIAHATSTVTRVRLAIIRDNHGTTAIPVITDVWDSIGDFYNGMVRTDDPVKNRRFTVIYDRWFAVPFGNDAVIAIEDKYIKVKSFVNFSGSGATDEGKGMFYIFHASNEPTNTPALNADIVYKYTDG